MRSGSHGEVVITCTNRARGGTAVHAATRDGRRLGDAESSARPTRLDPSTGGMRAERRSRSSARGVVEPGVVSGKQVDAVVAPVGGPDDRVDVVSAGFRVVEYHAR